MSRGTPFPADKRCAKLEKRFFEVTLIEAVEKRNAMVSTYLKEDLVLV